MVRHCNSNLIFYRLIFKEQTDHQVFLFSNQTRSTSQQAKHTARTRNKEGREKRICILTPAMISVECITTKYSPTRKFSKYISFQSVCQVINIQRISFPVASRVLLAVTVVCVTKSSRHAKRTENGQIVPPKVTRSDTSVFDSCCCCKSTT